MRIVLRGLLMACMLATMVLSGCSDSPDTYTVTYDGNGSTGGSVAVDTTSYQGGQTVTVRGNTGNLVKTGFTFAGWNTQANGDGITYSQGQTFTIGAANVILYARWTADATYTVTYDGNGNTGGSVPTDTTNYLEGQAVTVSANSGNLARTGYAFAGWNTLASGTGTTYTQGQTFAMGAANLTLYAKWTANATYSVTYNGNGNTGGSVPVDSTSYENGQTVTVLGNTGNLLKTGYSFTGWNTLANGTGTGYPAASTFPMGTANVTLYAVWAAAIPVNPGTLASPLALTYGTTTFPTAGKLTANGSGYYEISGLDPSIPYRVTLSQGGQSLLFVSNSSGIPNPATLPDETFIRFPSFVVTVLRANALPNAAGKLWVKVDGSGTSGADYNLDIFPATVDGWFTRPKDVTAGTTPGIVDNNDSYYHVSGLAPNGAYYVSVTNMTNDVDLLVYSFADFTGSNCWSQTRSTSQDEICIATADAGGNLWVNADGNYIPYGSTSTYNLRIAPAPVNQGTAAAPVALAAGTSGGTVGAFGDSYYVISPLPLAQYTVRASGLFYNIDMGTYSTAGFSSGWQGGATGGSNPTGGGTITLTTNNAVDALYIHIHGYALGATYSLTVE